MYYGCLNVNVPDVMLNVWQRDMQIAEEERTRRQKPRITDKAVKIINPGQTKAAALDDKVLCLIIFSTAFLTFHLRCGTYSKLLSMIAFSEISSLLPNLLLPHPSPMSSCTLKHKQKPHYNNPGKIALASRR